MLVELVRFVGGDGNPGSCTLGSVAGGGCDGQAAQLSTQARGYPGRRHGGRDFLL